jgi:tetratricopeptide (TPR) repeat protein
MAVAANKRSSDPRARPPRAQRSAAERSRWLAAAGVFALACAVYLPVREHQWLNYDDDIYVTRNAELERGLDWQAVRSAFTSVQGANWFPLTRLSWMLDVSLHGLDAGGFLTTNLLLHALASGVLLLALARLTGELRRSAFVAAVFAVHPLHVESVAWVSARKDVLSGLFFMLALLAFACGAHPRGGRGARAALFGSLALGLLAKPMLVTLPCVLLLLDAWPLARLARADGRLDAVRVRGAVRDKLPLFALAAVSSAATLYAQSSAGVMASIDRLPTSERLANALLAYVVYLRKFVWPSDLAVFYPHAGAAAPVGQTLLAAAFLLGATLLAARAWPRRGYVAVGWLWFLGMLVPTIGLIQVGSQALADRYMYLPLVGLTLPLAWGVPDLVGAGRRRRIALGGAALLVVAALGVATRLQLRHWQDSVSLFAHALEVTDENAIAHAHLGAALAERGRLAETVRHYREAVRIRPGFLTVTNNLAWLLATTRDDALRDPASAVSLAERAVQIRTPPDPAVLDTLAAAYAASGRFDDAVRAAERAVELAVAAGGPPALVEPLRARLALYREGRAYFE